jgi:O-antigen/teichoic acid export membrane protein
MSKFWALLTNVLRRAGARGFWALVDQGVMSLGTFAVGLLLARNLEPAEYGAFGLILGMLFLLNIVHSSLVTYPMSIRAAELSPADLGTLVGTKIVWTALASLPLAAGMGITVIIVGYPQHALSAMLALLAWQVQETARRGLMAHLRYRDLLAGDTVKAAGWAAMVALLILLDLVSLGSVLLSLAGVSTVAALIQSLQIKVHFVRDGSFGKVGRDAWRLGKLVLIGSVLGFFFMQFFSWVLAAVHGLDVNARVQAMLLIMGVLNPVIISVSSVLLPAVSHAHVQQGLSSARRTGFSYGALGAMLIAPYLIGLIAFPDVALRVFFGAESPYLDLTWELRFFASIYFVSFAASVLIGVLNATKRTRGGLVAQIGGGVAAVLIGVPLIYQWGLWGSIFAAMCVYTSQVILASILLRYEDQIPWRAWFKQDEAEARSTAPDFQGNET